MLYDRPVSTEAYALVRFGLGYPALGAPVTAEGLLARLTGPDRMAQEVPFFPFQAALDLGRASQTARRDMAGMGRDALRAARAAVQERRVRNMLDEFARAVTTDDPFRERLTAFWANHFAAGAKSRLLRAGLSGYVADTIRPNLTGRFADMLKAVATHPYMLFYLDQRVSVGPGSPAGQQHGAGLNENFARELLELHTLGVDADYSQGDVRQLAELLTGLSADVKRGFRFRDRWVEPGAEHVLGRAYGGGDAPPMAAIEQVLEDLAVHPATARHLSTKLARHFIADNPPEDLVTHMAAAYARSGGRLLPLYEAMLEHPAAWAGFGAKAKRPLEFLASALRALRVPPQDLRGMRIKTAGKLLSRPMARMGQRYDDPPGPQGWSDTAADWITPHGIAARISSAMLLARHLRKALPDPRSLVYDALGELARGELRFAATASETKQVGVTLVLASAEFNRR